MRLPTHMSSGNGSEPSTYTRQPTSVYKYYDHLGLMLYVGITKQATGRNRQHNAVAEWWEFVTRQEVEHHTSREKARLREAQLIRQHRPPFNKQHNPDWQSIRAAYFAFRDGLGDPRATRVELFERNGKGMHLTFLGRDPKIGACRYAAGLADLELARGLVYTQPFPIMTPHGRQVGAITAIDHGPGGTQLLGTGREEIEDWSEAWARLRFVSQKKPVTFRVSGVWLGGDL